MLLLLAMLNKISCPYLNILRKQLVEEKIAPLTITNAPNIIGHPIGIAILLFSGLFLLPSDILFYVFWLGMVIIASIASILTILGFVNTKFFTTQIIGSLGFVSSSICASIFLGDHLNYIKVLCLILALLGVMFFSLPQKINYKLFAFDKGIVFTVLAVILGGFSSVLYKAATFHVSNFGQLLTGRFITDYISWTLVWFVVMWINGRNPILDFKNLVSKSYGIIFIIGAALSTLIDSWIIYKLPVSTVAIIGTLIFPVTYLISSIKFKEHITVFMWLGTICIVSSIVLFLQN